MKVSELVNKIEYISVHGATSHDIAGLVCDSRQVRAGYMFVAISGTSVCPSI